MTFGAVDWTNVLVALIAGLPAIIAAIGVLAVHQKVKTPSGTSIGKQVENALHTALANNYRLRSIGGEVEPPNAAAIKAEADRAQAVTATGVSPATVPPKSA